MQPESNPVSLRPVLGQLATTAAPRLGEPSWQLPDTAVCRNPDKAPSVLVIDDDAAVLRYVARCLRMSGFRVAAMQDGRQGVAAALLLRPDVVVCDVTMPDMDGHAVLQELRRRDETRGASFIFLTAKQGRADVRHGMRLGADDYLPKPFSIEELVEAVSTRLDRRGQLEQANSQQVREVERRMQSMAIAQGMAVVSRRVLDRQSFERALLLRAEANPTAPLPMAIFRVKDLDRVHHQWGPSAAENLLEQVGARLGALMLQENAIVCAGRAGLHRFALAFVGGLSAAALERLVVSLLADLLAPYSANGREIFLQFGVGVTPGMPEGTPQEPTDRREQSLRQGEAALQFALSLHGSRIGLFSRDVTELSRDCLRLEADLFRAVQREELEMHLQPQVDLDSGVVQGFEALVRWRHPELGLVPPSDFVPAAERNGSVRLITEYVLRRAVQQMAAWQRQGVPVGHIAVNVSVADLEDDRLVHLVTETLAEHGVPGSALQLEVTESAILRDVAKARRVLQALSALGVQIAIDDFGVGHSSLAYLSQLKFDVLKIDKSFVANLESDDAKLAIVEMILKLAMTFGFRVVAEGIEADSARRALVARGCKDGQGYLFGKPLPQQSVRCAMWSLGFGLRSAAGTGPRQVFAEALQHAVLLPMRQDAPGSLQTRRPGPRALPA